VDLGGTYVRWRKPWPAEMDEWGHPRHGPDGNATSLDRIVGPPRRVRWVSGPMHEASNAVTAGGRYFHGGLVGRDAFNGIRLWDRVIKPAPHRLGYISSFVAGSMRPVATGDRVYVMEAQELLALDARSGRTLKAYPEAAQPRELLVVGDVLVAVCGGEVRAVDAASGALLWKADCADPDAVVASDGGVFLMQRVGAERGRAILRLDIASGKPTWRQEGYDWAAGVKRLSYQGGRLVCEVSTLNNDGPGNEIRVLAAEDGRVVWQYVFVPGMTHYKQARALQTGGKVWVLNGPQWEGLDPVTGSITQSHRGGTGHCFPPVATAEFLISGEMNFTDFTAGRMDANQITKGACGRDAGFVPGNGLLYLSPKHCSCYPMLNGYVALAPAAEPPPPDGPAEPAPEAGPAAGDASASAAPAPGPADWPCYRADAWRSGATEAAVPANVQVRWTATLGDWPEGAFQADFKDDLYVRGPITQPVVAGGTVLVAQPDRHRVVALDAGTGAVRWDFIANGRVDTPPSVWRGLCLFGTRSGWVYALRMADGRPAWRLRIAPNEDRIVSFGQLESPWPVPGSVLVVGDTAYVAGGRQPLADGGLRVMALDPATGRVRWQTRIDKLPHKGFYDGTGLEFDGFDLLVAEAVKPVPAVPAGPAGAPVAAAIAAPAAPAGDGPDFITLSRWRMDPKTGEHEVAWKQGFAYYRTAGGGVMAPRGIWTYGPRMEYISSGPKPGNPDFVRITPRPLMVFRGGTLVASTDDKQRLFRRDFTPQTAAEFDDVWYNQRAVPRGAKEGDKNRAERLAHGAAWTAPAFAPGEKGQGVAALVWAGEAVFAAGKTGGLAAFAAADGRGLASHDLPPPVWDGMAAAGGLLYVSTTDGRVICLGGK
jgi:outer membrane protein assembly factor BamB